MQGTKTRARKKMQTVAALVEGVTPEVAQQLRGLLEAVRQRYLDALPIAAAIVTLDEDPYVECANEQFRFLAEWDERVGERRITEVPLLRGGPIGTRLAAFIAGEDPAFQFDTADNRSIGGRHFTVRFARLSVLPGQPIRCLISLIDKTAQIETEKSLRTEMLRDSLTGLPNRFAFNEKVDAVLTDPAFREGSYAVLAVDMTRFSRVNECMGAIAGDELLITFARRLVSALRPSDVLARTSGDEFGILMRLDRGPTDAFRAAERIKAVLTLPFRLSELGDQGRLRDRLRDPQPGRDERRRSVPQRPVRAQERQERRHHPDLRAGPGRGGPAPLQHGNRNCASRSRPTA